MPEEEREREGLLFVNIHMREREKCRGTLNEWTESAFALLCLFCLFLFLSLDLQSLHFSLLLVVPCQQPQMAFALFFSQHIQWTACPNGNLLYLKGEGADSRVSVGSD